MTASKILLLIIDGVGDRPCRNLGNKTPLEAASLPNLDRLAAEGICGIMDPIAPGVRAGSDTSHLSLLGYDPHTYYTGRGPLEAAGCGIKMEPGMIGFRANYATVDDDGKVIDRRAGRIPDTAEISAAVKDGVDLSKYGVEIEFAPGTGHRAALALRGKGLSAAVSSNDPKKTGVLPKTIVAEDDTAEAAFTAEVCNAFAAQAAEILKNHPVNLERKARGEYPANAVLIRGAGEMGVYEPFEEKHELTGSVVAAAALIAGIGSSVGLERIPVLPTTPLADQVNLVCRELEKKDFVLFNVKAADEYGHDGKAVEKMKYLEEVDAAILPFFDIPDLMIAVCGDHSTPCTIKDHSADPVPLILHGDGTRIDTVTSYDEISCAAGGMCRISGGSLMPILCDLIDKTHKYGA
ncbi:2,3-bisphosphoglycerate-independent phosphoglycerate mutase [Methanocorpusculum parvum]|uniref:2,3-bisphosphoglycerate-independent phosphoglycerate mutase n=1 Tax=Methanocorpusculum parvum TaxID=2193 RepID=A0AAX0Q7Z1_9EURY|nr:2,3-bisphosphoglycerate-independent phosphoglycerate mutase [Methanocorpusculum parvum]PAV09420.1 phosphoglycerate mutase [Methanocorpusculum parvum]